MSAGRVFFGFVVLFINILIIFLMRNKLNSFSETVFLLLLLLFALIILKGWKNNSGWAWPAMIIFLALALANNVYIFIIAKHITVFIFLIMLNVWSIVLSMVWSVEKPLPKKDDFLGEKPYEVLSSAKRRRKK
ncbi:hypothetical protein HY484_03660 [Candidatus Woesearchaeota archaeon]|nr:hypothetical protein [Candidatus Woesearchaeota archaeon]